ncbi:MAG: DUF3048 domain-containing protein [Actinomycetes bacterium]
MATSRRPRRTLALLLGCAVLVAPAACSSDDDSGGQEPDKKASKPPARLPLTGEVAKSGIPDRPALVVKVDNTSSAEPQIGLGRADLVVEELVEGGATRLAAFYQSRLPGDVGPVRSMRTSDAGIVAPTEGVLVASGAAGVVTRAIRDAGIPTATEGAPGFSRDGARPAPYNLVVDPKALIKGLDDPPGPPGTPYLPWATSDSATPAASGKRVTSAQVTFSPAQTTRWGYTQGQGWTRENGLSAVGDSFVADQLLVLRVTTKDAGYRDPAGNPVPETVTTGEGRAVLLLGDRRVNAAWEKASEEEPFRLATKSGEELTLPPGNTWIELVPKEGGVTTG